MNIKDKGGHTNQPIQIDKILSIVTMMIKVNPQIMTSYDIIANERPVYTVINQW